MWVGWGGDKQVEMQSMVPDAQEAVTVRDMTGSEETEKKGPGFSPSMLGHATD